MAQSRWMTSIAYNALSMGYQHRVIVTKCGQCDSRVTYRWEEWSRPDTHLREWNCSSCGAHNTPGEYDQWPPVPRTLYLGHERHRQLKLYPVPPEFPNESWSQPYSIRSFVFQASRQLGGCKYSTSRTGEVMGESVFSDRCESGDYPELAGPFNCRMVAGWTTGESTCPLWEQVSQLCQSNTETKFLHWYLGLAKDRQFPMLIPQARIGIAERRRPDFVLFVPVHYWKYNSYAIQLDGAHPEERAAADELRDAEIAVHGYEVIKLKPEASGYYEEVRRLVERIESEMQWAETDPSRVATEVPLKRSDPYEP